MQRRLAIALVSTALVSVLLVGFGILAIARVGARTRAEGDVTRALNVMVPLLETAPSRQLGQLGDLVPEARRRDLQLDRLQPVVVTDGGVVESLLRGNRGRRDQSGPLLEISLTTDQMDALGDGETVLLIDNGSVVGLRSVSDIELERPGGPVRPALLAAQPITAVPRRTVAWFVLSSGVVLVGALAAGLVLARRLVRPIRDIQGATAAIAAGRLATRVEVVGDDELAELGGSVNRMAADLERSKALDQQFLLSVSHDLRTPLTAISGYAEALRDRAVPDPAEAGEIIGNHAARLDRLVGDLLDLARLDANRFRLDLRPVDLAVVAGRTATGLAPEAANHDVTISPPTSSGVAVLADADRLAQAIGNMIDNAITFANQQVSVTVTTKREVSGGEGGVATVTVTDDGPGFAPDELPHVFDRLYTGRTGPRRAESSTGLGLAIVRELAGAMGGSVEAANEPGGGARIVLSLPLYRDRNRPSPSPTP